MGSDHYPLIININSEVQNNLYTCNKFNFKKANWRQYTEIAVLQETYSSNIDAFNSNITDKIIEAATIAIPKVKQNNNKKNKSVPYWTDKCKMAINKRKASLRKHKIYPTTENFNIYKAAMNYAVRTVRNEKESSWENYSSTLTEHSKLTSVWKMAKRMNGSYNSYHTPTIIENNKPIADDFSKAEVFAQHFATISADNNYTKKFRKHKNRLDKKWEQQVPAEHDSTKV